MRIAMVSEHASPLAALGEVDAGGQNVHVAELSSALARQGHRVTVYTRRDDPELPERVRTKRGFDVVHVPAGPPVRLPKDQLLPHMGDFARYLDQRWSEQPPDVAHSHFWMSGLATILAAKKVDAPVVHTYHALGVVKRRHQGADDTSPPSRISIEKLIGMEATRIAATCTDEVFELIGMGVPRSRISVVPCGVDVQGFTPYGKCASRSRTPRIVSVGRLLPRKGFDIVITALRTLPGVELVIAGGPEQGRLHDDPEAKRLMACARAAGVADRVSLVGQKSRAQMPALLRSADIVVCVPWYEPFGIVPLEAMACGVPVVAAAVGGLTDTVVDGVTGLHVPPRDPRALARTLRALLGDRTSRDTYGAAGCDRVHARYSWDQIAIDTLGVYERACAGRSEHVREAVAGGAR
ncbi:MAG TPA: glycosyltransferase [Pseudonocardiaceae bacterium]|nr:glycosyltransferase [Pseudonocardiaceae bacterium]